MESKCWETSESSPFNDRKAKFAFLKCNSEVILGLSLVEKYRKVFLEVELKAIVSNPLYEAGAKFFKLTRLKAMNDDLKRCDLMTDFK